MEEIIKDVVSATAVKAFLPFTVLPDSFAGKQVKIVLSEEQSDTDSLELSFPLDF